MIPQRLAIADENFSHYKKLGKIYLRDRQGIALRARELAAEFKTLIGNPDIQDSIDISFNNIFPKNYFSCDFDFDASDILIMGEKLKSSLSELHCRRDFLIRKKFIFLSLPIFLKILFLCAFLVPSVCMG
ncbi:hypothetical protein [Pectobacterium odoriferum]|uniref:hypothetical protein n=1 Tax=Pectobacterium odoriferum TaxID=78398 RepID=UPI000CD2EE96|nr:hypothetical protein [Pectobacterium odoriferum]POE04696.1 hypothetical protein BV916_12190 [Pectobacterium odoriferum]